VERPNIVVGSPLGFKGEPDSWPDGAAADTPVRGLLKRSSKLVRREKNPQDCLRTRPNFVAGNVRIPSSAREDLGRDLPIESGQASNKSSMNSMRIATTKSTERTNVDPCSLSWWRVGWSWRYPWQSRSGLYGIGTGASSSAYFRSPAHFGWTVGRSTLLNKLERAPATSCPMALTANLSSVWRQTVMPGDGHGTRFIGGMRSPTVVGDAQLQICGSESLAREAPIWVTPARDSGVT
jgi:hypothetical protein